MWACWERIIWAFSRMEDAQAAVGLLQRCITELSFYQELKKQVAQRAPLFDFATESSTWLDLIRSRLAH